MSGDALRALLAGPGITHLPGVYDPVTAALAVRAGHRAVYLPWAAVSALSLGGRADPGHIPAAQVADRAATLVAALDGVPMVADAEIGDGDSPQAVWTAFAYLRAGISGLHLADRADPRDPGAGVIGAGRAAATISALAGEARGLALIARTHVYAGRGLAAAVDRCRAYAAAGADAVCAAGVHAHGELAELHRALPGVPIVVDRSEAAALRLPDAGLAEVGVRMVLHPTAALLAAARAASLVYRSILDEGDPGGVDRLPWAAFTDLTATEAGPRPAGRAAGEPPREVRGLQT